MLNWLKKLFSSEPATDLKAMAAKGATILDVRTTREFQQGHINGSINIPLQNLNAQISKIQTYPQPIITCCASGMRSQQALVVLKAKGLEAYNGGGWRQLNKKIAS